MILNDLLKKYDSNINTGLNSSKVLINRKRFGENIFIERKKEAILIKFLKTFKDSLIIILMISAIISVILDPSNYFDSIIILIVVLFNSILGVIQEISAEKGLDALKKLSTKYCKVIRNNKIIKIESKMVVVGDIMLIEAGDYISADSYIIEANSLTIDESSLTGESIPINKNINDSIYSSTLVITGKAKALVTNVGMNTEVGKIANLLNETKDKSTPLQKRLANVGTIIGVICICICISIFILELIGQIKAGNKASDVWIECLKSSIALAVAAIPEGLATVVTIILAIGVNKMSKQNAIVKKLLAVETLGSCNVICSDKTGTLTQNKMEVKEIFYNNRKSISNINNDEKILLYYLALCSDNLNDSTEKALIEANLKYGLAINNTDKVLEIPFDSDKKIKSVVIKKDDKYLLITKGAFDKINKMCVNDLNYAAIINNEMANDSLRILALAIKEFDYKPTIEKLNKNLNFIGLVGMHDEVKKEARESVEKAKLAGVKTVMITGDYINTAKGIAKELNMEENAISKEELDKLSDVELANKIEDYSVFARVTPKDKMRIVEAFQKRGYVVAMTGDGVNDAPALKKADIGCSMGKNGTDVAKEASDIILTDDNFSTIVVAIKEGRGIYDNIKKCIRYLLSSNIGEVFVIFISSTISIFSSISIGIPLLPIHLLWINLITDSLPAFGIGMQEAEDNIMLLKPRNKDEGFFADKMIFKIILEGIIIGFSSIAAYFIGFYLEKSVSLGQTMAFFTLSTSQLFHSFNVKANHSLFDKNTFKNHFMNFAIIVGLVLQLIVIYVPFIKTIFKFESLNFINLIICLSLSLIICLYSELLKMFKKIKN